MLQEIILFLFFTICIIPFVISLKRGRFDIFEPVIWFSIFQIMIGIAIIDRIYLEEPFVRHSHHVNLEFEAAFLLISVLYTAFTLLVIFGYYLNIEEFVSIPKLYSNDYKHNSDLLRKFGYIYIIIGLIFYFLLIWIPLDGQLLRIFTTTEPRSELFAGYGILSMGAKMLHLGYTIWLISKLVDEIRPRAIHLLPVIPIMSAYLLLGSRGQMVGVFLNVLIILYYALWFGTVNVVNRGLTLPQDRLHFYARQIGIPLIGMGLVIVVVISRGLRQAQTVQKSLQEINLIRILTGGIQNTHLDYLIILLEVVPDEFGYYYGTFYSRVLLNWIPRAIWPDKPSLTLGSKLRRVIMPESSGGRPTGIIGRYYVEFGYFGIFIGAILTGILMRYVYELLRKNGHSPMFLLIYVTILFSVVGGISNNSLFSMIQMFLLLCPVILADRIIR